MSYVNIDKQLFINWVNEAIAVNNYKFLQYKTKVFNDLVEKTKNVKWYLKPFFYCWKNTTEIEKFYNETSFMYLPKPLEELKIKQWEFEETNTKLKKLTYYHLSTSEILQVSTDDLAFLYSITPLTKSAKEQLCAN